MAPTSTGTRCHGLICNRIRSSSLKLWYTLGLHDLYIPRWRHLGDLCRRGDVPCTSMAPTSTGTRYYGLICDRIRSSSLRPWYTLRLQDLYIPRWRHLGNLYRRGRCPCMSMAPTLTYSCSHGLMSLYLLEVCHPSKSTGLFRPCHIYRNNMSNCQ